MTHAKVFLGLLLLLCSFFSFANPVVTKNFKSVKVDTLSYSFSPTSAQDAYINNKSNWRAITNEPLNLGFEQRPVWLAFTIKNTLTVNTSSLLSLDNPLLNEVQIYHFYNSKLLSHTQLGDAFALSQRTLKSESLLAKLTLPANSVSTIIIKVSNSAGLRVPITLWQQDAYLVHKSKLNLIYGLLIGFLFSLAISCLVLYGFSRKLYFAYAGVITLILGVLLAYLCGFGVRYFHPNTPAAQQFMIPVLLMLTTLVFLPLQNQICEIKTSKLVKGQNIITSIFAVTLLFTWALPNALLTIFCLTATPIVICYYLATTIMYMHHTPSKPVQALTVALIFFLLALAYLIIVVFGLYPLSISSLAFIFICFFSSTFCLCFGVLKQFILERDEQVITQQTLIAENAAQDTLLKERLMLQEQAQKELESQVDERTFELQVTLRELEDKNHELEQLNMEDALTGVKNRRFFDKKLIMELRRSRREQTPLSIIMLDIDRFKSINDNYGHLTGDQVIRAVADTIKQHLKRPLDDVARYGGEEFVILLPNTAHNGVLDIAEKIRKAIEINQINVAGTFINTTVSAGTYTAVIDDINNPELFTHNADKALYYAKQHGRNQVISFPIPQ
ncbi:diguanylate cyclase [Pseudoalteromonas sp. MMG007]|uniref:sensor domain-containing diguanylate cyclase n=1 Tax=Pseudoalteromonas sp. MMG007 TaxID=2822684 RepID=UPI001B386C41|nr:diguanylate cyclase [Pseudoalteromonas sp. MMG007]MBQ4859753.1 diguanylate cyclase [Pseudoalteromonas sp. MMG007]